MWRMWGTAGARQLTEKAETVLAGCKTPDSNGFIMFSKYPSGGLTEQVHCLLQSHEVSIGSLIL